MSIIILIYRLDDEGNRIEPGFFYSKSAPGRLENVTEFEGLVGRKPTQYHTGLGALEQQRRLEKVLVQFGRFELDRVREEGNGLTAFSRISNGMVRPKNVRGG